MKLAKILLLLTIVPVVCFCQKGNIQVIDFVKVKENRFNEANYFYENNWKVYRDLAIKKGFVKSYKLLSVQSDSATDFNFILITEYADSNQLKLSEPRFQEIIKKLRPSGPVLLNELKPSDFRITVFSKKTETVFSSKK